MICDLISDLHGHNPQLEGGDLLIVAGDCTRNDHTSSQLEFLSWMQWAKYTKKVLIAGNHDNWMVGLKSGAFDQWGITYLCDSGTEFECWDREIKYDLDHKVWEEKKKKLKIWGSPWTKTFSGMNPHCKAFTVDTEEEFTEKWALIPDDIDILVTHSPPYGIKDKTIDGRFVGSESLAYRVGSMKIPPKLWVWGHIHEAYGIDQAIRGANCIMVNASHVNERYQPVNAPIRIEL